MAEREANEHNLAGKTRIAGSGTAPSEQEPSRKTGDYAWYQRSLPAASRALRVSTGFLHFCRKIMAAMA